MLLQSMALYPVLVAGTAIAVLAWGWVEMFGRFREADARISTRPGFAVVTLVIASALTAIGLIMLTRALLPAQMDAPGGSLDAAMAFVALPATGVVLTAILMRLGRAFRWSLFLRTRAQEQLTNERSTVLSDTMRANIAPTIGALEAVTKEMQRHEFITKELGLALHTIDVEVGRMKRLQRIVDARAVAENPSLTADVERACQEILARLSALGTKGASIRVFGSEGLRLRMEQRHLSSLLWGLLETAAELADPDDPVIELVFRRSQSRLIIECTANGSGVVAADGRLDECRLVAAMYDAKILPDGPPLGNQIAAVLDAGLIRHDEGISIRR